MAGRDAVIKVACISMEKHLPYLFELDQSKPLKEVVEAICKQWKISNPEEYAFKSDDTGQYVTNENRNTLSDGAVLKLAPSPLSEAQAKVQILNSKESGRINEVLLELPEESKDETFSRFFIEFGGIDKLGKLIEVFRNDVNEHKNLGQALSSYARLVSHEVLAEEAFSTLNQDFMKSLLGLLKGKSTSSKVTEAVLEIAKAFVLKKQDGFAVIYGEYGFPGIVTWVEDNEKPMVQEAALKLINSLILKCPEGTRESIFLILEQRNVVAPLKQKLKEKKEVSPSLAHELYCLQTHFVSEIVRAQKPLNHSTSTAQEDLQEIVQFVNNVTKDGRKRINIVGFANFEESLKEFQDFPLCLEQFTFLKRNYPEEFKNMLQHQISRDIEYVCPLVKIGKKLSKLLLRILDARRPGKPPDAKSTRFLPLWYTTKAPLEHLFCIFFILLERLWNEMRARRQDEDKVMTVTKLQMEEVIQRALMLPNVLEHFREQVWHVTYQDIQKKEEREIKKRFDRQVHAPGVRSKATQIRDELSDLVHRQRIARMKSVSQFVSITKGKVMSTKKFYAFLSANQKTIHWSDFYESTDSRVPTIAEIESGSNSGSVSIEDLKLFEVGNEVPAVKAMKDRRVAEDIQPLCFGISVQGSSSPVVQKESNNVIEWLVLIAPDRKQAATWRDGIRLLMGKPLRETETFADIDTLVSLKQKILLLNVYGVELPTTIPLVPSLPENFEYSLDGFPNGAEA
eukprot:m.24218 g.24218  ORF g.24218 m.24218 type:complete len:738 (+) comp7587_c0_seq1:98-2311(+)